jgi:solute carrier family 25 carnitine/acylcarnitine transporter 20/29
MGGGGNELQRLTSGENLLLGLAAGMGCKSLNYPLLHWKNKAQQGLPISYNPSIVYRGLPMAMMNLGGTTALQFGLTGLFQKLLAGGADSSQLSKEMEMLSSFLAGFISGIPCSMYELTMIQQQGQGGSIMSTPARLVRNFGAKIYLRGMTTTMGRESLYTMGMLGGTPIIQRRLMEDYQVETSVALAVGSLIGAVGSVVVTHPMDTIKVIFRTHAYEMNCIFASLYHLH